MAGAVNDPRLSRFLSNCGLADCILINFKNGQLAQVMRSCRWETEWMLTEAFVTAETDEAFREQVMPLLDEEGIATARRLAEHERGEAQLTTTTVIDDAAAAAVAIQSAYYWLSPGPIRWAERANGADGNTRQMRALLVAGQRSLDILDLRAEDAPGRDLDMYADLIATMTGLKTILVEERDLMRPTRLFDSAPPTVRFLTIRNWAAARSALTASAGRDSLYPLGPLVLPNSIETLTLDALAHDTLRRLLLPETLRTLIMSEPNGGLGVYLRRCCILGAGTPALAATATRTCPSSFGPDIESIELHVCLPNLLPRARADRGAIQGDTAPPSSFSPAASTDAVLREIAALHACPRLQYLNLCLDLRSPWTDDFFERLCPALAQGLRNKPDLRWLSVNTMAVLSPDQCARLFEVIGGLGASLRTLLVCGVDASLGSVENDPQLRRTCAAIGRLGSLREGGIRLSAVDRLDYTSQAEWPPFAIVSRILHTAATCNPALEKLDTGRDPQMATSIREALVAVHETRRSWHRSRVAWEIVARGMLIGKERRVRAAEGAEREGTRSRPAGEAAEQQEGGIQGEEAHAHPLLSTADRLPPAVLAAVGAFFWGRPAPLKLT